MSRLRNWARAFAALWLFALLTLVGGLVLSAPASTARAQAKGQTDAQTDAPRKINIGLYIINLEQLNVQTGNFTVEFYLTFKCDGPCGDVKFRIINGKYQVLTKDADLSDKTGWLVYQIRADLNENLNLQRYPFDTQYLRIRIESDTATTNQEVYVADPTLSALDPELKLAGWEVERNFTTDVVSYHYAIYDDDYSRYVFTIPIYRPPLFGWLKALLPAVIILISGFLSYLFRHDMCDKGIAVVTSALVGSVLFNINLTSGLPSGSHLTIADLFMIVNYIGLVVSLAVFIAVYVLNEIRREHIAKFLLKRSRVVVPVVWLVLQIGQFIYSFLVRA